MARVAALVEQCGAVGRDSRAGPLPEREGYDDRHELVPCGPVGDAGARAPLSAARTKRVRGGFFHGIFSAGKPQPGVCWGRVDGMGSGLGPAAVPRWLHRQQEPVVQCGHDRLSALHHGAFRNGQGGSVAFSGGDRGRRRAAFCGTPAVAHDPNEIRWARPGCERGICRGVQNLSPGTGLGSFHCVFGLDEFLHGLHRAFCSPVLLRGIEDQNGEFHLVDHAGNTHRDCGLAFLGQGGGSRGFGGGDYIRFGLVGTPATLVGGADS